MSLKPGGSVFFEHRNLQQEGRQLSASVSTSNFFAPQEDIGFKLEYVRPYVWGSADPKRAAFKAAAFNARKLSPVFTGGPTMDDVPPMWVDRSGAKATITDNFTRQSKITYGVVAEEITLRDEAGTVCPNGMRSLPTGQLVADGPPTTLSDRGTDRLLYLHASLVRDNTYFEHGATLGVRDIYEVDQGVGLGSARPFFNRHTASLTRFLRLPNWVQPWVNMRKPNPPASLVLHAKYGGCLGDLPSYDAFALGGPHSARAYNVGELGVARRFAELAGEVRATLPFVRNQVYGFAELATDLGSSAEVRGNPTEFYRRAGSGAAWGGGLKFGGARAEWCVDGNARQGHLSLRFGDRF